MRAILCRRYGSPDVLTCEETERPEPGDHDVLIAVRAASVNPLDWHTMRGEPYAFRIVSGLRKPKRLQVGADVAGRVEAVGRSVTRFRPGDEVFGVSRGAFAEYACTAEANLVTKPSGVTFEQAAAVPVAGFTALQGLRDKGRIQPGQKVLINGAAGGVGTFAVQIAKLFGAEVTGVCGTRNVDLVRSIGADHAVDYTREDFAASPRRYDVMLDCIGNRSLSSCRRALTREGTYVGIGAPTGRWIAPLPGFLAMLVVSRFVSQRLMAMIAKVNAEDLGTLRGYLEAGRITPVIDRRYGLTDAAEAVRYLEAGHARGKVVLAIGGA
jgi:NADPH:quinone reductase-like Zn-dependent oxidoreductase